MKHLTARLALTCAICVFFVSCDRSHQNNDSGEAYKPPVAVGVVNKDSSIAPIVTMLSASNAPKRQTAGKPVIVRNPSVDGLGAPTFTNYSTEQGLALSSIGCGYQDKSGNLWFGTYGGGVSRYDGKEFTNFTTAQGLVNNSVLSIAEDNDGNLWFGTNGGGVSRYDGRAFQSFTTTDGLANNSVWCITKDRNGNLWFGTRGGGVSRFDGKVFRNYTTAEGLAHNVVWHILEDRSGILWFGTDAGGVSRFDGRSFSTLSTAQGLVHNSVWSIAQDRSGYLWFGTYGGGVSRFDGKTFTNYTTENGLGNNSILEIVVDKSGSVWFGTNGGGVSRYDGGSFTTFNTASGLASNSVYSITEDKAGNLWFGTDGGGVSRYDGTAITNYTTAHGLANSIIWNIVRDKSEKLWFGTNGGGVSSYDGSVFASFTTEQGLANNIIWSIAEDRAGHLWFGTRGGGVSTYDGRSFTTYTTANGLVNNSIRCICEDKQGNLWFGSDVGGISKFDGKSFTNFTTAQGLANNFVYSIAEDPAGALWFGTDGGGVSRYDGSSFTNFTTAQGLANNCIRSIMVDKAGSVWFATDGGGVSMYDGRTFTNFSTAQGLADDVVYAIAEDTLNNAVWCGSNLGLSMIQYIPAVGNKSARCTIKNFNNRTGYPIKDVNSSALCIDGKGIVWAGCGDGKVIRFDYRSLNKNARTLSVQVQSVAVDNENICWHSLYMHAKKFSPAGKAAELNEMVTTFGKVLSPGYVRSMTAKYNEIQFDGIARYYPVPQNLILPYNRNSIGFEFGAIEPAMGKQMKYAYLLEGYDKEWSPLAGKTNAHFGNMPEGKYTFRIKALSPDGLWGEAAYSFAVLPPWYRAWWAYLLYLLGVSGILSGLVSLRTASLRRDRKILEQKVKDRTAEVVRQREMAEEQRKKSDDLLLNILPADVAAELKSSGRSEARLYKNVSVLFTDFVDFSRICTELTPVQLVAEIDRYYKTFDGLMEKHGIEKIKTIGDSYMAVSGLPQESADHAVRAIRAALEIRDFIIESRNNGGLFDIRIGVHSGSVVAGIVGDKKFAYDIWGDTVNAASRMESSCTVDKVNISGATFELVKDHFVCSYRGKVRAKNIGEIDMYFVEDKR